MIVRVIALAGLVATAGLCAAPANAQFDRITRPSRAVDSSARGDGQLEIGRSTTRALDRASIDLKPDGKAEVRFYRGSTAYVFTGRWSNRRGDILNLQLDRRDGVPVDAYGRVYLRGSDLDRAEINGSERGQDLRVSFRSDRSAGGTTLDRSDVISGDGRLQIGRGTTRELNKASVDLQKGGKAEVRVYRGSTPYVFTGEWKERGSRGVELQLDRRDRVPIRATGTATFRPNGQLVRVQIDGWEARERLTVSFNTQAGASGQGPFDYINGAKPR